MDDMWIEQLPDDEPGERFSVIVILDPETSMWPGTQRRIGPLRKTSLIDWLKNGGCSRRVSVRSGAPRRSGARAVPLRRRAVTTNSLPH
jgi:hypothetical protein